MLVSIGRRPNSAVPGLDKTGVKVNQRGFIEVDPARADGGADDLRDRRRRRRADARAQGVARSARRRRGDCRRARGVRAARDPGGRLHRSGARLVRADRDRGAERRSARSTVARFPWAASGRAITLDRTDGMTKLVLDPKTERVLGVGIVGPGAGELISEGVLAVEMGANADRPEADHPPAPDAVRNADGVGRSVLRPGHARLQAEAQVADSRARVATRSAAAERRASVEDVLQHRRRELAGVRVLPAGVVRRDHRRALSRSIGERRARTRGFGRIAMPRAASSRQAASKPIRPRRRSPADSGARRPRRRDADGRRRSRRASACCPAARSARPRRCRRPSAPARRRRAATSGCSRTRPRASRASGNRRSPSPVKTRPVRLAPCAAGARPSTSTRASRIAKAGDRPPQ